MRTRVTNRRNGRKATVLMWMGVLACGEPPTATPLASSTSAITGAETLLWSNRSERPPGRVYAALCDQPARDKVVLYGGWRHDLGVRRDTWEWDGAGWIERVPDHDPGPRFFSSCSYDPRLQRVLLFGGFTAIPSLPLSSTETWEWSGHDWAPIRTDHAPSARAAASMVWDPILQRTLLYGGFTAGESARRPASNEIWSFDGNDWTQLGQGPLASAATGLAIEPSSQQLVLVSGYQYLDNVGGELSISVEAPPLTWTWDHAAWTPLPSNLPQFVLTPPALAIDSNRNELALVVEHPPTASLPAKGAVYTLSRDEGWQQRQAWNTTRTSSLIAWSSVNHAFLLSGGRPFVNDQGAPALSVLDDDATVSVETAWTQRPKSGTPSARERAAIAQLADGRSILFGGLRSDDSLLADTWMWDGGRWSKLSTEGAPPARHGHAMAALGEESVLLFGGAVEGDIDSRETWKLTLNATKPQWTKVSSAGPPASRTAAMAPLARSVILFGGESAGVSVPADTWQYREPNGWTKLSPATSPRQRSRHMMVGGATAVELFGGRLGGDLYSDHWRFDGTQWSRLDDSVATRSDTGLARDRTEALFLWGGTGGVVASDVWDLAVPGGLPLQPIVIEDHQEPPRQRAAAVLTGNPRTGGVIAFGGRTSTDAVRLDDTWQLTRFGASCTQTEQCDTGQTCTDGVCCEASSCGPCRSCAIPGRLGLCTARGSVGPEPGCDQSMSCSAEGRCRRDNRQTCLVNDDCASNQCLTVGRPQGICCAAEGCAVRCVDDNELQQPDGTRISCAPYACSTDHCNAGCRSIEECATGYVCNDDGACVANVNGGQDESAGCSCRSQDRSTPTSWLGVLATLVMMSRRSRSRRAHGPSWAARANPVRL